MAVTVLMWHTQSSSSVSTWWLSGCPVATRNKAQKSGGFYSLDWRCQAMMHGVAMWNSISGAPKLARVSFVKTGCPRLNADSPRGLGMKSKPFCLRLPRFSGPQG